MSTQVDLLDEDRPIAEQKFVCLSFVSPEKVIKNKEIFFSKNLLNNIILTNPPNF